MYRKDSDPELNSRKVDDTRLSCVTEDNMFAVFVTYIEIYNNSVYDLLEDIPSDDGGRVRYSTVLNVMCNYAWFACFVGLQGLNLLIHQLICILINYCFRKFTHYQVYQNHSYHSKQDIIHYIWSSLKFKRPYCLYFYGFIFVRLPYFIYYYVRGKVIKHFLVSFSFNLNPV